MHILKTLSFQAFIFPFYQIKEKVLSKILKTLISLNFKFILSPREHQIDRDK
jgi:hypothetical protein